ncbi:MAG: deaminase [Frankiales bacterium]|jgi:hypothetical protein|nr:deaminase [Frankiales bacterium]
MLGRRLHQTMLFRETADQDPALDAPLLAWAELWKAVPNVVFSPTASSVQGDARLATRGLAGEAAALGPIDEYRLRGHPVLVSGGTPLCPRAQRRVDLELLHSRTFASGVLHLRYGVLHWRHRRTDRRTAWADGTTTACR